MAAWGAVLATKLSSKLPWEKANPLWATALNAVLSNPTSNPSLLTGVQIVTGVNVINHGLQQTQQGWFVVDTNAAITLYRSAPFNDLTLTLTASGPATVNIAVF